MVRDDEACAEDKSCDLNMIKCCRCVYSRLSAYVKASPKEKMEETEYPEPESEPEPEG